MGAAKGTAVTGRHAPQRRVFGEISKLPSGRFRARFRLVGGERVSAPVTFVTRLDAEYWLAEQERALSRGDWQPPPKPQPQSSPAATSTDGPQLRH